MNSSKDASTWIATVYEGSALALGRRSTYTGEPGENSVHSVEYIGSAGVERVLVGVPKGHEHVRVAVELSSGRVLVFGEAAIANIVRGFLLVKTHPTIRAVELSKRILSEEDGLKEGYSRFQLLETGRPEAEIEEELAKLLEGDSA